jgi:hypothetical protein
LQGTIEQIEGRKLESITLKNAQADVVAVFENGSRGTIDKWDKVFGRVSKDATLFAYNRPGYANSDAADTPRDGATIVKELRQVLQRKGLKPPCSTFIRKRNW